MAGPLKCSAHSSCVARHEVVRERMAALKAAVGDKAEAKAIVDSLTTADEDSLAPGAEGRKEGHGDYDEVVAPGAGERKEGYGTLDEFGGRLAVTS